MIRNGAVSWRRSCWSNRRGEILGTVSVPRLQPYKRTGEDRDIYDLFLKSPILLPGSSEAVADRFRAELVEWYGKDAAAKVHHAEAFEICEYGRRPNKKELAKLFPFFSS